MSGTPQVDERKKEYLRKIDAPHFFDRMLSKLLIRQPANPVDYLKEIITEAKRTGTIELQGEYSPKLMEDTAYIKQHNITYYINALLEDLLRELPEDYMSFYLKWITDHPTTALPVAKPAAAPAPKPAAPAAKAAPAPAPASAPPKPAAPALASVRPSGAR
eukprot:RCo026885